VSQYQQNNQVKAEADREHFEPDLSVTEVHKYTACSCNSVCYQATFGVGYRNTSSRLTTLGLRVNDLQ